jgi:glycosyltransferase involved in cell wall biosynthesis
MRFGLDGIPLQRKKTGVGHYTSELARSLAAIAPEHEFELLSPPSVNGLGRRTWWSIGLPLYCRRTSVALFHGTNFQLPYWSPCPTVLTIHDLSLLLYPQTHEKRLVVRAKLKLPRTARRANAIITPSEAVKREVCEYLNVNAEKVFAIPEAARRAFYPILASESRPICERLGIQEEFILFVGTVEPRKNLLTLVRAFEQLLRTTSLRLQLVIAGEKGWMSNDLMAHLNASGIRDRVLFTGHLTDDDLRALYSACRIFAYPSLYEGFGLPLLEAMSCGAPVVTSNLPAIVETVGDVARLVPPTDIDELAGALAMNAREREHRSRAGIDHAKNFSWDRTAAATLQIYERVLSHKKSQKAQKVS